MENLLIFPLNEIIKIDYTLHQQKIKHQLNSAREKQDDFLKSYVSAKKKIDNEKEVEKQMNFYISDMHLGHKKIIQMSKRPFENVEEMQEKMIENRPGCHRHQDRMDLRSSGLRQLACNRCFRVWPDR